jgi:glycosyltransferase involved in cell wall biosynthesis
MPFLVEAIASILAQTFRDFDLVVIDNGSTDNTLSFVETIKDPRVRLLTERRRGAGGALNAGLRSVASQYVAVMNADDVATPERLERQIDYLNSNPEAVLVGSGFRLLVGRQVVSNAPLPQAHGRIRRHLLAGSAAVCHASVMYRTLCARAIRGYRIEGAGQDLDFILRIGEIGSLHNIPEPLMLYRLVSNSASAGLSGEAQGAHAYAITCAAKRAAKEAEPTVEEFSLAWANRGKVSRLIGQARSMCAVCYLAGITLKAEHKVVRGAVMLGLAALCDPVRALLYLERFASARWRNC